MIAKKANKKRQFYKYIIVILFVGAGLIFMSLVFFGRRQDIEDTVKLSEETISFLKGSCRRYDNSHIGNDAEAMQDVLDKTQTLKEYMNPELLDHTKSLEKLVKLQNLTGALVLDKKLNKVVQADLNGKDSSKIFHNIIHDKTKNNILTNKAKVYSDKVKIKGNEYYVAMVSRQDQEGLILCYKDAKILSTDNYNYSFSEILANNTFHKNPKILITDGKQVLATNAEYLSQIKKAKDIPNIKVNWKEHQLTKIKFNGKKLYGMRQVYDKYYIYVCYESAEIFANLIPVVTVGVAVYIFFIMCMLLVRQNMHQKSIMEQTRQIQTIKAISSLYVATALFDLDKQECIPIQNSERLSNLFKDEQDANKIIKILRSEIIAPKFQQGFEYFLNAKIIKQRMNAQSEALSYTYQDVYGRWYASYVIPVQRNENGDIKTVLVATRDIDKHQKKEIAYHEDLKSIARDAKLANAAKTTFLRRMSHDIRTPINGIRGMATLAKFHLGDPKKELEYINKIITSTDYLLDLVNDVLQMNKLESGKIYLENKSFDMRELIKDTVELCKMQADQQDIKMSIKELKTEHAYLIGSPLHLRQITQNLITNAIRYNRAGGTVDVSWKEIDFDGEKATYEFICADTGIGMSEEFQKHLYEPFVQENDNGRSTYSGTGLGLPIVKQLVQHMGGTISFTSKKGVGTTFTVIMPLKVDMNYKKSLKEDTAIETLSIEGIKILLVEDNEINMQIARELLEAKGACITEAHDGKEAVQIFETSDDGEFDVILMDIMMPVMDGLDATRYIRGMKRVDADKIPIFAMTANAFIEDINTSKAAGMNEHFSKPLDMEKVIKTIYKYNKN